MAAENGGLCRECQIGRLRPTTAFFFSEAGGHVLSIPDFPAWACDVCALRLYDESALAELRAMLELGRPARKSTHRRVPGADDALPGRAPAGSRRRS